MKNPHGGYTLYIHRGGICDADSGKSVGEQDILDVKVSNGVIMLVKPFRHKTLEERAAAYDGRLDLDGEFDWRKPVGRETWE